MSDHSAEPWSVYIDKIKGDPLGRSKGSIASVGITIQEMYYPVGGAYGDIAEKNAKRIVACVNACAGVADEMLAKIEVNGGLSAILARNLMNAMYDAKKTEQRDELLAVLKEIAQRSRHRGTLLLHIEDMCGLDAIIANIEGQS